jgi:hypothetical protein
VQQGPEVTVDALASAFEHALELTGTDRAAVRAVGLDSPGPACADGVISSKGPHDLRHTFATWLEDAGIPSRVIDELMATPEAGGTAPAVARWAGSTGRRRRRCWRASPPWTSESPSQGKLLRICCARPRIRGSGPG